MICSILASTPQGGIGNKGTLPWPKHKQDLAWFKNHTTNNVVIMGRNTWNDPKMPKPLPDRINCIFTSKPIIGMQVRNLRGDVCSEILGVQKQFPTKDIFVIGGKEIYLSSHELVQRIYLTRIKLYPYCDTRLELDKYLNGFRLKSVSPGENCTYEIWDRI